MLGIDKHVKGFRTVGLGFFEDSGELKIKELIERELVGEKAGITWDNS